MNDCFLNLLFSFQLLLPLKDGADFVGSKQTIIVILENFCYCLIQKTLGELPDFEVMTWQLCNLLRSTLNCLQGTLILLQRYEFYLYIKSTVLFIMSLR